MDKAITNHSKLIESWLNQVDYDYVEYMVSEVRVTFELEDGFDICLWGYAKGDYYGSSEYIILSQRHKIHSVYSVESDDDEEKVYVTLDEGLTQSAIAFQEELNNWEVYEDYLSMEARNYTASNEDIQWARDCLLDDVKPTKIAFLGRSGAHVCLSEYDYIGDDYASAILEGMYESDINPFLEKLTMIRGHVHDFVTTDFTEEY